MEDMRKNVFIEELMPYLGDGDMVRLAMTNKAMYWKVRATGVLEPGFNVDMLQHYFSHVGCREYYILQNMVSKPHIMLKLYELLEYMIEGKPSWDCRICCNKPSYRKCDGCYGDDEEFDRGCDLRHFVKENLNWFAVDDDSNSDEVADE